MRPPGPALILAALFAAIATGSACDARPTTPAEQRGALRARLAEAGVHALEAPPPQDPALVALGRALMFDKILSGNEDISCASCHHPTLATADQVPISIGTGGRGLGRERVPPADGRVPAARNATDLFLRGDPGWTTMFFDMRVRGSRVAGFATPANALLPADLDSLLAVQAMFPVTARAEMRGQVGDRTVRGELNELALLADGDVLGIWDALMDRLRAIPAYVDLFAAAYPEIASANLGLQHAANAIAAFEIETWSPLDSPFDRFLAGDDGALEDAALRGALLFYGDARCASCHAGPLLSDQRAHALGVPQLGPGQELTRPLDLGFATAGGNGDDRFRFRTPPLRNVALTGPWMHDGAYARLEDAVRHHLDPERALRRYDPAANLPAALVPTVQADPALIDEMVERIDPVLTRIPRLDAGQVGDLLAFLDALTAPAATLPGDELVPRSVPSGLPVED